jgi:hypothetical protein
MAPTATPAPLAPMELLEEQAVWEVWEGELRVQMEVPVVMAVLVARERLVDLEETVVMEVLEVPDQLQLSAVTAVMEVREVLQVLWALPEAQPLMEPPVLLVVLLVPGFR